MPETTLADFVATFLPDSSTSGEPVRGRVVLSQKRLVFAASDGRTTVAVPDIFDVVVGHIPRELAGYFDDTVAIGYRRGEGKTTAILEADADSVSRFTTILFKVLLQGATVRIRHPARVGGRYTEEPARTGSLNLEPRAVSFRGDGFAVTIDLSSVTHFQKVDREVDGRTRPALNVQHTTDGRAITTELVMKSPRRMNLLGRYLRLEYSDLLADVRDVDLSETDIELLVALYSGAAGADLAGLVGRDVDSVGEALAGLAEANLVSDVEGGYELTARGRLAVSDTLESINF